MEFKHWHLATGVVPALLFWAGVRYELPDLILGTIVLGCAEVLGYVLAEILIERIDHA